MVSPPKTDRTVVVTGASRGIGQAIAVEFAARGCSVFLHAKSNLQGIQQTIDRMRGEPSSQRTSEAGIESRVQTMVGDLRNPASRQELIDVAFRWRGNVDVWVHAAGADVLTGEARGWSFEQKLRTLWETDVEANFALSRSVAQRMASQPQLNHSVPSIVHLGWDQAEQGMEGDSGQYFAAVKAAVAAFSKSLAKTMSPKVRVNCVAPGWIQTEWGQSASSDWHHRAQGESMLGRWGTPGDVARAVVAISCDCEFLNAQTIAVNGGWQPMQLSVRSSSSLES